MMGTLGVSLLGSVAGVVTDRFGPTIPITIGAFCLLAGYLILYYAFVYYVPIIPLLAFGSCLGGFGSTLAYSASIKTAALNFPLSRGTAVAFPLAAFGLSAFFFTTLSSLVFPGNTPGFLMLLAVVTSSLCLLNVPFVKTPKRIYKSKPIAPSISQATLDENVEYGTFSGGDSSGSSQPTAPSRHYSEATLVSPLSVGKASKSSSQPSNGTIISNSASRSATRNLLDHESQEEITTFPHSHKSIDDLHHSFTVWEMFSTVEFWAQFTVLGLLAGVGQMYIYCCGYIVRALVVASVTPSSTDNIAQHIQSIQSLQVALISIFSFVGRLLSGSVSDIFTQRLRIQRLWMVFFATVFALIAHISMISLLKNASHLWIISCIIGISYGMMFGVFPTIVCDTFGISHFSKNWGFTAMSPVFSIYIFNLMFGTIYDKNSESPSILTSLGFSKDPVFVTTATCLKGTACYSTAFVVTSLVSVFTLFIIIWMIYTEKHQPKLAVIYHTPLLTPTEEPSEPLLQGEESDLDL